jgi:DNA-binding transcriptional ArsR family regulator
MRGDVSQTEDVGPVPASDPDLAGIDVLTVLQALSDPVRLDIVRQLGACPQNGAMTCGQVEVPVAKSTATHHFKTLHTAGITSEREEGTRKFIRLRKDDLEERFPGLIELLLNDSAPSEKAAD